MYGKLFLPVISTRTSFLPGLSCRSAIGHGDRQRLLGAGGEGQLGQDMVADGKLKFARFGGLLVRFRVGDQAPSSARIVDCVEPKPP